MTKIEQHLVLGLPLLLAAAIGCQSVETPAAPGSMSPSELEGTWVVVSSEANGHKGPDDPADPRGVSTVVFHGDQEVARRGGEVWATFNFTVDPSKRPKTLDETLVKGVGDAKKFEGKKSLAIYELNGDTLKVCWTVYGAERERPAEFATAPGSHLLLDVCKREKE
jgi:uncharacterized protein (TIGR03067 family)